MQVDQMKVGETYELDCRDSKTNEPITVRFTIIENGWYPSPIKPSVLFHGVKVRLTNDPDKKEHVVDPIMAEFVRRVEPSGA